MADLKIKITGDSKGAERAIGRTQGKLKAFGSKLKSIAAGPIGMALGAIAVGFIAIAGAAIAVKRALDPLANEMDNIAKGARRIGLTTKEFQELAFAARRTGASTETVEKAFKRMQKTIFDAGNELSTAKRALEGVGLAFDDLKGKRPEKQFEMIAEQLALITDESKRNAIAQDLFGRAGLAITPLIQEYKKLKTELQGINGIISDESIKSAEDYKDALENLTTAMKAFASNSGAVGLMASAFEGLNKELSSVSEWSDITGNDFFGAIAEILGGATKQEDDKGITFHGKTSREDTLSDRRNRNKRRADEAKEERERERAQKELGVKTAAELAAKTAAESGAKTDSKTSALGSISAPSQQFDSLRSIGGGIMQATNMEAVSQLRELEKQTIELQEIAKALDRSRSAVGIYTGPDEGIFKDGS